MPRRLGILGGIFDPIHLGTSAQRRGGARGARARRVYFVPAESPAAQARAPARGGRAPARNGASSPSPAIPPSALPTIELERRRRVVLDRHAARVRDHRAGRPARSSSSASTRFVRSHTWKEHRRPLRRSRTSSSRVRPPSAVERSIAHLPVAAREAFCYDPPTLSVSTSQGTRLCFLPDHGPRHLGDGHSRARPPRSIDSLPRPAGCRSATSRSMASTDRRGETIG